ncbi:hypothetical protein Tco_0656610 [Tanacetum coccineum]|uniref:Xylulose kinase-1 n=1 Tax=Tanacetum coccineum TaxID=301880 RepID=A0ABQ4X984_9ASTR
MLTLKFAETYNLVAFLEKPEESNGFEGIIDFLNASSIKYALTVNPIIYTSCIKQLWATAKVQTVNEEVQIQALVDGKKVIVTEGAYGCILGSIHVSCLDIVWGLVGIPLITPILFIDLYISFGKNLDIRFV